MASAVNRRQSFEYFHDADMVYAVRVNLGPEGQRATAPQHLWTVPDWLDSLGSSYDVSDDRQGLLHMRGTQLPERTCIQLIHNRHEKLETLPVIERC